MDKNAYKEFEALQNTHWWFVSKREIILSVFEKYRTELSSQGNGISILDIGCGMGFMLKPLSAYGEVYGMDCEEDAFQYCRKTWDESHILLGELPDQIPFDDSSFDVILSSDCLEHVEQDLEALIKMRKLLKNEKSLIILTVPALMCLWSYNDIFVHHHRRYNKEGLIELFNQAGFQIQMCSYYNFWLFPPIWLVRKVKNIFQIQDDDLKPTNNWTNKLLSKIFTSEKYWLKSHSFPYGVSLILVAVKGELSSE